MAQDTGYRERWSDGDPAREAESPDDRATRQHATDVDSLARSYLRTGKVVTEGSRMGQRAGETAEGMQKEVRDRIATIEAEFDPEDPRLAFLKEQFEVLQPAEKDGKTWQEVCGALRGATYSDGTLIESVGAYLAEVDKYDRPRIYRVHNGQLVIGDGGKSVPSATKGMTFPQAEGHCSKDPKSDMIDTDEWEALQNSYQTDVWPESVTWCKPGSRGEPDAGLAWVAVWGSESRCVNQDFADVSHPFRGARRVLRVNLAFES